MKLLKCLFILTEIFCQEPRLQPVVQNGDKTFYGLEGGSFYMMEANEFIFAFSEKCGKSAIRCSGRVERYRSSDKDSSTITWDECSATKKE